MNALKVFSGSSNVPLARKIVEYLGIPLGAGKLSTFPDGELLVEVEEDVRGCDVFVIQSTCTPSVNGHLMELLIYIDCLRRASATRITAVLPYFGYARQDRKDKGRVPISAKLVANLIVTAGVDRVLAVDLHAAQVQGFFDIPVDHLSAEPVISYYFKNRASKDLIMVSPDVGNVKQARTYADRFGVDLAIIDKRRVSGADILVDHLIGNVKDKIVLMVDDQIATAGTICTGARVCVDSGAKSVLVAATHAVLCGPAIERLQAAPIDEIIVTDTIPLNPQAEKDLPNIKVLTVSELLGEAIRRIHRNESVSSLFIS